MCPRPLLLLGPGATLHPEPEREVNSDRASEAREMGLPQSHQSPDYPNQKMIWQLSLMLGAEAAFHRQVLQTVLKQSA